ELAAVCLCITDEFGNRLGREYRIDDHHIGIAAEACDRCEVAGKFVIQVLVERCVDSVSESQQQERVAVGRRGDDSLGGEIAASPRPVLNDERLAKVFRQPLSYKAS